MRKVRMQKHIIKYSIIFAVAVLLEVFVGNWSFWRTVGMQERVLVRDVMLTNDEATGDGPDEQSGTFYTDVYTIDTDVRNVCVKMQVLNSDTGKASVILTDEGDKYAYTTPEFTVCNGVPETAFSNLYPFGRVHTIQVAVHVPEGCGAEIESISINTPRKVDIKWIRLTIVFLFLLFGCLVFTNSRLHQIYFDPSCKWQNAVTALVILSLIALGGLLTTEDPVLVHSPWPHHRQYQELAHSLDAGEVELKGQVADAALLRSENPYDTIALQVEGISYAMDYAYYDGHYYEYFGIVPELLFYYPYYKLTGRDLPNHRAIFMEYIIFVAGACLAVRGLTKRYIHSIPYFFYMAVYVGCVLLANFVYLTWRTDIYNVPIMGAVAFTFAGIGLWLHAFSCEKKALRILLLGIGSLSMALVAGCRPQFLILSGVGVILFLREGRSDKTAIPEMAAFAVPYMLVAVVVCWYNYARFGNIFDFGATYSLTTNDMNHRGFNFSRLFRSLYCFWLQPAATGTDFPFLQPALVDGNYMGKFLSEFLYGGILTANAFFASIWLWLIKGFGRMRQAAAGGDRKEKRRPAAGTDRQDLRVIILYFAVSAVIISAFDANAAGLIYRYTCDFAPALVLAAALCWLLYLDRAGNRIDYILVSRLMYVCLTASLLYTLFSFCAGGSYVCLENDNPQLFYRIASYFML